MTSHTLRQVLRPSLTVLGAFVLAGCADDPLRPVALMSAAPRPAVLVSSSSTALTAALDPRVVFAFTSLAHGLSFAYGINDAGLVVGEEGGNNGATVWTEAAGFQAIARLDGNTGCCSSLQDVNASGAAIGFSHIDEWPFVAMVLWSQATNTKLNLQGLGRAYGHGINDNGDVVGTDYTGFSTPFFKPKDGSSVALSLPAPFVSGDANKINNDGVIVGAGFTMESWHAVVWARHDAAPMDLGSFRGNRSWANDVNDAGDIVGWSETTSGERHAFLWTSSSGMIDLNAWPNGCAGASEAFAINQAGIIVGKCNERPVLWTAREGMRELALPTGVTTGEARAINDKNVIAGSFNGFGAALWTATEPAPPATACTPVASGLIGWWRGEDEGTDVTGQHDGHVRGGVSFVSGMVGKTASFDGASGYLEVPDAPALDPTTAFTFEAWVNPSDVVSEFVPIIGKWDDIREAHRTYFLTVQGGRIRFSLSDNGEYDTGSGHAADLLSSTALRQGVWQHVAAVYDGTDMRIHLNGQLDAARSTSIRSLFTNDRPLLIGAADIGSVVRRYFAGQIDEPAMYARALTASEIGGIYQAGSFGKCYAPPNSAPTASAGSDQSVNLSGSRTVNVVLDGSASADDGQKQPLTYSWSVGGSAPSADPQVTVSLGLGVHAITLTVDDGELQATDEVIITVVDPSPPAIAPLVSAELGNNGWYRSDVSVQFSLSDPESDITDRDGCDDAIVRADTPGIAFTCTATSAGGTSEVIETVKRDATKPLVSFDGRLSYTVDEDVAIRCDARDELSGLAESTCAAITGPAYTFGVGAHAFSASATDYAGNEAVASGSFTVVVTAESLCTLVERWIAHAGTANSLCAKLDAARRAGERDDAQARAGQIAAFVNEVEAQSGKYVPADKAITLTVLARAL